MGLTRREEGYYVAFSVLDDGKVLRLARGDPRAKLKRWKTGTFNKTRARELESIIRVDLLRGAIASSKAESMTFAEWGEQYLALEAVKRLRSYKERKNAIRLQLIPFFGKMPLNTIELADVETFRAQRVHRKTGKPPKLNTINNDHTVLKHCLGMAERRGLVGRNVAKQVPLPDPHNERDRVLSEEEWNALYRCAAPHIQSILLVAYHLGPRLGELLNLTWDRVDMQQGFLKLRASDTKTREPRLVPLTSLVGQEFAKLAKVRSLTTNHVFLYEGKPIKNIKKAFRTCVRTAKVTDFKFHDFRHCAVTNLRRAGVDTITAMRIVGHKSEKMHKRYNSIECADLLRAASLLDTLMTPAGSVLLHASVSG